MLEKVIIAWCQVWAIRRVRYNLPSGVSLTICAAWPSLDGTQQPSYWPILAASRRSPASIWSVVDSIGPNWVIGPMGAAHSGWFPSNPTKHKVKPSWPLIRAWQSFGPAHRTWTTILFACCSRMWPIFRRQSPSPSPSPSIQKKSRASIRPKSSFCVNSCGIHPSNFFLRPALCKWF